MAKIKTVDEYLAQQQRWQEELAAVRAVLQKTGLDEAIKWGAPCYLSEGTRIVALCGFKEHFALWFYRGSHLNDHAGVLVNAQKGKTKELRQWRMTSLKEVNEAVLLDYVKQAVEVSKTVEPVKMNARSKDFDCPEELTEALGKNKPAAKAFKALTAGRQYEYAEYIREAKRATTKQRRLEKILPMICAGVGLHDKYRKKS